MWADYYPNVDSDGETVVVCTMVLVGVLLWAYVLSQFCDMATNSSPGNTEFKQLLDGLNEYLAAHYIPPSMHHRLREYLHEQKPNLVRRDILFARAPPHALPAALAT